MRTLDLTNKKFGMLTALRYSHKYNKQRFWECLCDCGNKTFVRVVHLTSSAVKSCGCQQHFQSKWTIMEKKMNFKDKCQIEMETYEHPDFPGVKFQKLAKK